MNSFFTYCIDLYIDHQPSKLAESTKVSKRWHITCLLDYLENNGIQGFDEFKIDHVYDFINSLPFASQTISGFQFTIRDFFDIMFSEGIVSVDGRQVFPVIFTNKRDRIISYYQTDEISKLIETINITLPYGVRDKCMVLLAAQTGLRASDIIELTFDEIKWDKNLISKKQKKTKRYVTVPFPRNIKLLLLDYIKNYRPASDEKYVFICPRTGTKYSDSILFSIVNKYFDKSGIIIGNRKHGPHALRHSLASNLLKNNTPVPVITGILGQKDINTTSAYLSIDIDSLRRFCLEVPYE